MKYKLFIVLGQRQRADFYVRLLLCI